MKDVFGYNTRMLKPRTTSTKNLLETEAAVRYSNLMVHWCTSFKIGFWIFKRARAAGAKVHTSSPVLDWETRNGIHYLRTPMARSKLNESL